MEKKDLSDIEEKIKNIKLNDYVVRPHKIPNFIDINILKEYVKKDIESNKEYFDDKKITYKINDPKKAEWIIHKAIKNSKIVGDGNTKVDVIVDNIGLDVSVLSLVNRTTNEKSIMQNFKEGIDLDTLFKNKDGVNAIEIFRKKLESKFSQGINCKEYYYLIFICNKNNIYLSCLKIEPNNIKNMSFESFTKSCKNITVENFIETSLGNVKLYKSKKRLELRLYKTILDLDCSVLIY